MYTLILYVLVNGHMTTSRLTMPDEAACKASVTQMVQATKAVHGECKAKKAKLSKDAD